MVPLDLHVLGTPPAFVLSQDQTLHYRVVDCSNTCWRTAVRRRTVRFDLRELISSLSHEPKKFKGYAPIARRRPSQKPFSRQGARDVFC